MSEAAQTPLLDLLRDVPADARQVYEHDSMHSQNIPFGRMASEAADTIEAQAERVRVLREALDGLLLSHPHANDGMHGYSVIVTTDQVLACRSARAALEATK